MKNISKILLLNIILIAALLVPAGVASSQQPLPPVLEISTDKEPGDSSSSEVDLLWLAPAILPAAPAGLALTPALDAVTQRLSESEPNDSLAQANSIPVGSARIHGNIFPAADLDFFAFQASVGDRIYAAVVTSFSANAATDSLLSIQDAVGNDLEVDNDDGSLGGLSSTIAGLSIPTTGTYFLKVSHSVPTGQLRPYTLYFHKQTGSSVPEVEPNNDVASANPLPASGWASGTITAGDADLYSLTLNAGDTVFMSLDLDPERDGVTWNGRLGIGTFANYILVVNDASTISPNSEFHTYTVQDAGTYYIFVDEPVAGTGNTYQLSVSTTAHPNTGQTCTTYTNETLTSLADSGTTTSTITIPESARIADLDVSINLTHTFMPDLDVVLTAPNGSLAGLVSDIGGSSYQDLDITLDDEAAIPANTFIINDGGIMQPELAHRLSWFDGMEAQGTWTLTIYDDTSTNTGELRSWGLTVCEAPLLPYCPAGSSSRVIFGSDFEANDGGFTHSGTQDEWEWGTPSYAPLVDCASGSGCWKTDLDNSYNPSSSQDLESPVIDLTSSNIVGPITLTWAQNYQIETASFDHASVEIYQADDGLFPIHLWDWLDATMTVGVGNPTVTLQEEAGWGIFSRDISNFKGDLVRVRYHLDADITVQLAGIAIDDFTVTACTNQRIYLPLIQR